MIKTEDFAKVDIDDPDALWDWLEKNHDSEASVWMVTWRAHHPARYVSTEDSLDALVAHGWIDGVRRKLDGDRTMQLISPRKTQYWAKSYKDRAARLEAEGRMHPAGRRLVEEGRRSGLWSFMDDVDALIAPADLVAALKAEPPALERFEATNDSYRRIVLRWIKLAKTAPTRAKRIAAAAQTSAKGERLPQM